MQIPEQNQHERISTIHRLIFHRLRVRIPAAQCPLPPLSGGIRERHLYRSHEPAGAALRAKRVPGRNGGILDRWAGGNCRGNLVERQGMHATVRLTGGQPQTHWLYLGLLGNFQCIVNFNPQVPHGAFQLRVAQQQLNCPQVFGSTVE